MPTERGDNKKTKVWYSTRNRFGVVFCSLSGPNQHIDENNSPPTSVLIMVLSWLYFNILYCGNND